MVDAPAPDVALDLGPEAAAEAIATGRSLLGAGALSCETDEVAAELRRLAGNLSETSIDGSPAQRTAQRLPRDRIDGAPFLPTALADDAAPAAPVPRQP